MPTADEKTHGCVCLRYREKLIDLRVGTQHANEGGEEVISGAVLRG